MLRTSWLFTSDWIAAGHISDMLAVVCGVLYLIPPSGSVGTEMQTAVALLDREDTFPVSIDVLYRSDPALAASLRSSTILLFPP